MVPQILAFADDFRIVFDSDQAGWDSAKKLTEQYGKGIEKKVRFYGGDAKADYQLENFFEKEEKDTLLRLTGSVKF